MHLAMDVCSLNGAQRATIWQLLGSRYTQNAASFGPLLPLSMVSLIACHQTFGCFSGKCPSWTGMGDFLTRFNCHRQKFHQWTIAHLHVPTSRFDTVGRFPCLCFLLACDTYGLIAFACVTHLPVSLTVPCVNNTWGKASTASVELLFMF